MYLNKTSIKHNNSNQIQKLFIKTLVFETVWNFMNYLIKSTVNTCTCTYIFVSLEFGCFGQMYNIFQQAVQEVKRQICQFLCEANGLSVGGTVSHCLYQQGQCRL